jgi:hypothetical protein
MFEVFRQDFRLKKLFIFNNEAIAIVSPFDDVTVFFLLQYSVCLDDKICYLLLSMNSFLIDHLR